MPLKAMLLTPARNFKFLLFPFSSPPAQKTSNRGVPIKPRAENSLVYNLVRVQERPNSSPHDCLVQLLRIQVSDHVYYTWEPQPALLLVFVSGFFPPFRPLAACQVVVRSTVFPVLGTTSLFNPLL